MKAHSARAYSALVVLLAVLGLAAPSFTFVTYLGNGDTGGSPPADGDNFEAGQTVTVLGNTGNLVRTGYTFVGWNTEPNGSGTTYTEGQTFTMRNENVFLYGKWASSNANLSSLIVENGQMLSFSPLFSPDVTEYTLTTSGGTVAVTPTSAVPEATITINKTQVGSETPSQEIALVDQTTIHITVTAEDTATTKTYGISVVLARR